MHNNFFNFFSCISVVFPPKKFFLFRFWAISIAAQNGRVSGHFCSLWRMIWEDMRERPIKKHPLVSSAIHNGVLLCTTCVNLVSLGKTCWRAGAYEFLWKATMRYSSLISTFSLTPTSAVFHSRSHSCKRSRAAEKRSCQCNSCVLGLWSTTPLRVPSYAICVQKEPELGS